VPHIHLVYVCIHTAAGLQPRSRSVFPGAEKERRRSVEVAIYADMQVAKLGVASTLYKLTTIGIAPHAIHDWLQYLIYSTDLRRSLCAPGEPILIEAVHPSRPKDCVDRRTARVVSSKPLTKALL